MMNAETARRRSQAYADLARAFAQAEPGLEREFTRLFLGPGRPVAHPYESVYREGRTMGDTTLDVRRRLIDAGLAPADRTLPDHVSVELAFVAHLAAREVQAWADGQDLASDYVEAQDSFLQDHLVRWLPQFCHRILAGRPHDHYARLAQRAEAFVTGDAARLRAWLSNGSGAAENPVPPPQWAVTVSAGCTQCDICVQVCRPGALQQIRAEGQISLCFDAACCDGCAACQRWCPEEIITLAPLPEGAALPDAELAQSDLLACPRCGRFHAPAAMVAKVQAQMGPGQEALQKRLAMCHECKLTDVPLRRRPSAGARSHFTGGVNE